MAAKKSQFFERDLGWKRIQAELEISKKRGVRIGVQAGETGTGRNGTPIIEYAFYNEFGSEDGKRPPERSFIRSTADERREVWSRTTDKLWQNILQGKISTLHALSLLGQLAQKDIQQKISNYDGPNAQLAKSTEEKKGSTTPLIDTGAMRSAIRYVVEK